MSQQFKATILSVGTELTEGSIQDSHGQFLSGELKRAGIPTVEIVLVPDVVDTFRQALVRLIRSSSLVIITGGLGPTSDDLTREVVAEVAGVELAYHEELWEEIERRFAGRPVSQTNRKQCLIPSGFTVVRNPYGTAPAFWGEIVRPGNASEGALVVALPGPPRELRALFRESVLPMLLQERGAQEPEELRATAFLLSESVLEQIVREQGFGRITWGTRAEPYRIILVLRDGTSDERLRLFEALQDRVGWLRLRRGEVTAPALVLEALTKASKTLTAAESCTGGLVGKLVTDLPGASAVFWGSLVVYSNDAKETILGVSRELLESYGAVSAETVAALARGAVERSGADVGCSISGVAGPSGGSPSKPVGTVWIGVAVKEGKTTQREFHFSGDRDMVRRKSAVAALLMCEATIRGKEVDNIALWQYI